MQHDDVPPARLRDQVTIAPCPGMNASACHAARFLVGGKVQGVFFRAGTRQQARNLGLHGYTRNLRDGRVEVLASGDPAAIDALARWLLHGPPMACVDSVERAPADATEAGDGFLVE